MSDANILRLILALAGAAWLAFIWWSGQRKPTQGARKGKSKSPRGERVEPQMSDVDVDEDTDPSVRGEPLDPALEAELSRLSANVRNSRNAGVDDPDGDDDVSDTAPRPGRAARGNDSLAGAKARLTRPEPGAIAAAADERFERIVSLHVAARPGETIAGPELVVAAEKAGLVFGERGIFHRLADGRTDGQPVFRVANMVKPGHFDARAIAELRTPGVTFFMTLPGPLRALDAWDTMLPAAQRLAELLDAQLLDEEKNTLGRQTIQHIRDELRGYDRQQEKQTIKRPW